MRWDEVSHKAAGNTNWMLSPCAGWSPLVFWKRDGRLRSRVSRLTVASFHRGEACQASGWKRPCPKPGPAIDGRHAARKRYRWPPVSQILHMTIMAVCSFQNDHMKTEPPPPIPPSSSFSVLRKHTCSCWGEGIVYRDCRGGEDESY